MHYTPSRWRTFRLIWVAAAILTLVAATAQAAPEQATLALETPSTANGIADVIGGPVISDSQPEAAVQAMPPQLEALSNSSAQVTLFASGDACVVQGKPDLNLGTASDMWVGYDESHASPTDYVKAARSLVRFDLSSLPLGSVVQAAKLRVYHVNSWDIPDTSRTLVAYGVGATWTENAVTWNNKPPFAQAYGSANIVHAEWGWYEFDVTDLVRGWVTRTLPNNGIMLRGDESQKHRRGFSTREGPHIPELVIQFVAPGPNKQFLPIIQRKARP
jgi:hypothetical protein